MRFDPPPPLSHELLRSWALYSTSVYKNFIFTSSSRIFTSFMRTQWTLSHEVSTPSAATSTSIAKYRCDFQITRVNLFHVSIHLKTTLSRKTSGNSSAGGVRNSSGVAHCRWVCLVCIPCGWIRKICWWECEFLMFCHWTLPYRILFRRTR